MFIVSNIFDHICAEQSLTNDENVRLTAFERAGLEAFYLHQRLAEQDQMDYKLAVTTQR
jgi:hypothetical protein